MPIKIHLLSSPLFPETSMPQGAWLGFCLIAEPSSFDECTPRQSMVTQCTAVSEPFYTFGAINVEAV